MAAWRVDAPKSRHLHPAINHLIVGIDSSFPFSDPRVVAPQAKANGAPEWPHIEPADNLCLRKLRYSSPASTRVLTALEDALEVLNLTPEQRDAEHRREFISYWSQRARLTKQPYLSLLSTEPVSRDIVFHRDAHRGVFFADDADALTQWLKRVGIEPAKHPAKTRLVWLDQPLTPEEFPKIGDDVMRLAGRPALEPFLKAGAKLPVLLGCEIDGNAVFVGVEMEGISEAFARQGFRPSKPRPQPFIAEGFRAKEVVRREVKRADYAWVHGRGRNTDLERLRGAKVAIVGCGALGGYIAKALAQAGVGTLILVDFDDLSSNNVGRHVLGMDWVGQPKAKALAEQLNAEFPHALDFIPRHASFQSLSGKEREEIAHCDLVVAAGITLLGERTIDEWRLGLEQRPALVWTWLEEFAVAGHAAGIIDGAAVRDALDTNGAFRMRLTSNWPKGAAHAIEAGCGVSYQPYSAVDMMGTVNIAHRLSLDVLLGKVPNTIIRSWLGDRGFAGASGCDVDAAFERSYAEISREWPW